MNRVPGVVISILLIQLCLLIVVGAAIAAYMYAESTRRDLRWSGGDPL